MREVELKAIVPDLRDTRTRVEQAGATLQFSGRLEDRRYDTPDRTLAAKDFVLRLRTYRGPDGETAHLDWKGPTEKIDGFKVRDELTTGITNPDALVAILTNLDYLVTREIDREIIQYAHKGAMIRFERYPRMDTLVEIEGDPDTIEQAITATGLPRDTFTTDRLPDFVRAYESRTGLRAALCHRELTGDYRYSVRDA